MKNDQSLARYQANRSLIQSNHPQLYAYLPEEYPPKEAREKTNTGMERIAIDKSGITSHHPKYAVIFGMSDGHWLIEYFQIHNATLKYLFIVEPDTAVFAVQMACHSWVPLLQDARVRFFIGSSVDDIKTPLFTDIPEIASWGIHAWRYIPNAERHAAVYKSFLEILQTAFRGAYDNASIQIERGLIMQCNILRNLPAILRSVPLDDIAGQFPHTPAVIIGAGPSLNRNIDALHQASPGVLLIASDTALRPLLNRGIHPHIVVSCDPLQLNHRHFEGISTLGNSILAYLPETNAGILQQFSRHPRLLCLHDLQSKLMQQLASALRVRMRFRRRMNVGYCAFILAQEMGCSPIILAGMDLAVSPGGLSHADGTANASRVAISEDGHTVRLQGNVQTEDMPLVPVDAYNGGQTMTFTYFHQILRTMEDSIAGSSAPVIDATEGGAKKRGAIQLSLREALRQNATSEPIGSRFNSIHWNRFPNSLPSVLSCIQEIHHGLQLAHKQIHMGRQRIEQWRLDIEENTLNVETISRQAEFLLTRLMDLLSSNALDSGVDIGLARWRYAIQRADPPDTTSAKQLADWWIGHFFRWFEGLDKDIALFENLYAHIVQTTQTILTSRSER